MRHLVIVNAFIATTFAFAATFLPGPDDRARSPVPETSLARIRGADANNPVFTISSCENLNLGPDPNMQADCNGGVAPNDPCVICPNDTATTATSVGSGGGAGFYLAGMTSCHSIKTTGVCVLTADKKHYYCQTQPWNGKDYCGGELNQAVYQTQQGPP